MGAVSAIELDAPAAPVASIPIVTTLAGSLVRGCIERLAEIAPEMPFETIVVLNGADPGEAQRLRVETSGVRIVESEVNLGSAGGLNLARPFARGEYLVSLHDDARPAPGWLDALIRAAESEPDAGAVGSLVLNRDGSVQAAGWHLLPDGSTRPPWSGDPPPPSAFTTRRAVDYAPMCSILIRARAWDEVGGMDERYAPAYYTDVDLALALRARGMRVLCEPASVVEHWRGTSSTLRFAQFVSGHNREKLLAKWGDAVMSHEPGSGSAVSRGEAAVPAQDCRRDRRARIRRRRCATSTAPGLSSAQSTTGSSRSRRGCPGSNGAPRCSRTSKAEAGGGCAAASCPPCVPPPPRDAPRSGSCSAAPDRPVEVDLRAVVAVDAFQMHPQPLIIPGEVTAHSQSTTVDTS